MNMSLRNVAPRAALCVLLFSIPAASVSAEPWNQLVTIVVPYGPGGGNDSLARILANELTGKLAKSVIVENKPGAGGALAVRAVKSAPPDGRTLLLCASITEIQSAKANPLYDVSQDLAPVILGFEAPYVLIASLDVPVNSFGELVNYDRQNPGKLSYASFGAGSAPHLAFELLKDRTNISAVHVPYRSNAESTNAVLANQVQLAMDTYPFVAQYVETGKVRALATTGIERDKSVPAIPTIAESGVPGYNVTYTGGIMTTKETSKEIIETINLAMNNALLNPAVITAVNRLGFSIVGGASSRYQETLNRNIGLYRKLISAAGISF